MGTHSADELLALLGNATESLSTLHTWTASAVTVRLVHGGNYAGPGTVTDASLEIRNDGPTAVDLTEVTLDAPQGWSVSRTDTGGTSVAPGETVAATFTVVAPPDADFGWDWSLTGSVSYRVQGAGEAVLVTDGPILPDQRR